VVDVAALSLEERQREVICEENKEENEKEYCERNNERNILSRSRVEVESSTEYFAGKNNKLLQVLVTVESQQRRRIFQNNTSIITHATCKTVVSDVVLVLLVKH
jgi:hypothetical protein